MRRELDDYVASQYLPDCDGEPVPAESLDQANRWLHAIKRINRHEAEIRAMADAERKRRVQYVDEWEARELAESEFTTQRPWLERSVEMLARALFKLDPKVITRSLPNGTFTLRKQQPEWVFEDETAFVWWARINDRDDLVNVPVPPAPKPDRNAVKKAFTVEGKPGDVVPVVVDGDVVPGLTVTFRDRKFEIKTEEP